MRYRAFVYAFLILFMLGSSAGIAYGNIDFDHIDTEEEAAEDIEDDLNFEDIPNSDNVIGLENRYGEVIGVDLTRIQGGSVTAIMDGNELGTVNGPFDETGDPDKDTVIRFQLPKGKDSVNVKFRDGSGDTTEPITIEINQTNFKPPALRYNAFNIAGEALWNYEVVDGKLRHYQETWRYDKADVYVGGEKVSMIFMNPQPGDDVIGYQPGENYYLEDSSGNFPGVQEDESVNLKPVEVLPNRTYGEEGDQTHFVGEFKLGLWYSQTVGKRIGSNGTEIGRVNEPAGNQPQSIGSRPPSEAPESFIVDLNDDGVVNEEDTEILFNKIYESEISSEESEYDYNCDKETTVGDAQVLRQWIQEDLLIQECDYTGVRSLAPKKVENIRFGGDGWNMLKLYSGITGEDLPDSCGGSPTAYNSSEGELQFHTLASQEDNLGPGVYLLNVDNTCEVDLPAVTPREDIGEINLGGNGWKTIYTNSTINATEIPASCGSSPVAYNSTDGNLELHSLSGENEIAPGPYLLKMDSACSFNLE